MAVLVRSDAQALRAELTKSVQEVRKALQARDVVPALHAALKQLAADLRTHIEVTEGPGGLHDDILATAPRLANAVAQLTVDHGELARRIEDLVERTRRGILDNGRVQQLLDHLDRHDQRGTDLLYESVEADIGGET